jgi:hypothetical protein
MKLRFSLRIEFKNGPIDFIEEVELWGYREVSRDQLEAIIEAEKTNWSKIGPGDYVPKEET